MDSLAFFATIVAAVAASTASGPGSGAHEATIELSTSVCNGWCPIYTLSLAPDGSLSFRGHGNTAVIGYRAKRLGREAYLRLAARLATYRPPDGVAVGTTCAVMIAGDAPNMTLRWLDGSEPATAFTYNGNCPNAALEKSMLAIPAELGVADWTKRIERPGTDFYGRGTAPLSGPMQ